MMAHKHLHELLKEDQEPFDIKSFIADKRCQLSKSTSINGGSRTTTTTTLQVQKRKPITQSSTSIVSKRSLCKHACFLSFHDSPDVRKSPFLGFPSPAVAKSPCKTQKGGVFFNVPASLLEAAMRVQKRQSSKHKTTQIKNVGFGLFGSILKRLKDRNKSTKKNIKSAYKLEEVKISAYEINVSSCNNSSVGWSESNEEKSMDLESSSSCSSEGSLEDAFAAYEKRFCSSPLSPFRFALQKSSSPGRRTPEFSSPVASPSCHKKEDKENNEAEGLSNLQLEDEEKEQNSPVSILDNPFEDDDDDNDGSEGGDEVEYEDDYEHNCSYAIVQRAKHQLMDKLRRFEKLAELDPIELEKRMDEEDYDENQLAEEEFLYDDDDLNKFTTELLSKSTFQISEKIPTDMKRLLLDLISEESCGINGFFNEDLVVKRVCQRLDSWKDVEANTIDMMVQLDFVREVDAWKRYQEQIGEVATEVEREIFKLLVEELTEDLVY